MGLIRRLKNIGNHPLNQSNRIDALARFVRWQVGSQILAMPSVAPFTRHTRLVVRKGMTGATGNIYCKLHDYEEMSFLLHFLRATDLFVDVGANVGTYTVLASGEVGATSICIEPIPATFDSLLDNVYINRMQDRVVALNCGVGASHRLALFTSDCDTKNHVASGEETSGETISVEINTLDHLLADQLPALIKLDVEGFEHEVIEGGQQTFSADSLHAVIVELNGSGTRYGNDDESIHAQLTAFGFIPHRYEPVSREIIAMSRRDLKGRNVLYLRGCEHIAQRLHTADAYLLPKAS